MLAGRKAGAKSLTGSYRYHMNFGRCSKTSLSPPLAFAVWTNGKSNCKTSKDCGNNAYHGFPGNSESKTKGRPTTEDKSRERSTGSSKDRGKSKGRCKFSEASRDSTVCIFSTCGTCKFLHAEFLAKCNTTCVIY